MSCNSCFSGCNYPCYSYGNSPCYGYNPCNPCKQPCGSTTLIINGCICVENKNAGYTIGNGNTFVLTLTSTNPCGASGKYTVQGITPPVGTLSGGGALLSTSQGVCSSCTPCCNNLSLTATLTDNNTTPTTIWTGTITGCCGSSLTVGPTAGLAAPLLGNTLALELNSTKSCCGSCTTCTITGGKLTIT